MKILYDGLPFHQGMRGGGVHRYARELISRVARREQTTIAIYGPADSWPESQASISYEPFITEWRLRENHRLETMAGTINICLDPLRHFLLPFRAGKSDIFHLLYYRWPNKIKAPLVVTFYDLLMERFPGYFTGAYCDSVRAQKSRCLRAADHVICISQSARDDLREHFGVPDERSSVVYLAADCFTAESVASDHLPVALPNDDPFVLHVGQRLPHKNFPTLLEGFALWPRRGEARLVSVGGAPGWTAEEKQLMTKLGIANQITKLGRVDDQTLTALYRRAICTVCPSFYEGFGLPVLEAMRVGGVVASANTSSLPEVGGDAAFYFDPNDACSLSAALTRAGEISPARRQALVGVGMAQAKQFSWDRMAAETIKVYQRLAGKSEPI